MLHRTRLVWPVVTALVLSTSALLAQDKTAPATATAVLRTVAIPDANTVKDDQQKVAKWLAGKTGVQVEFLEVKDYAAAVTALATGKAELGWLGGVTTVQAMQQSKGKVGPFVTTDNNLHFKSYVIANKSLGAKSLEDLKGKTFTFGNKTSTSGHIMARYSLEQKGIDAEKFFAKVAYSGNHTNTVLNVAGGAVDCGVLNYATFDKMVADKKAEVEKVEIVWTTPEYVDYAWNVRSDVDAKFGAGTLQKIKQAFLSLDGTRPEDQVILKIHGAKKYEECKPIQWDGIRAVLDKVDITK